jgi:hypothetical protein
LAGPARAGCSLSTASATQFCQARNQSSFRPLAPALTDQLCILRASSCIRSGGRPCSTAHCAHSAGNCQSFGREVGAFFGPPIGGSFFGVVGLEPEKETSGVCCSAGARDVPRTPPTSAEFRRRLRSRSFARRLSAASSGIRTASRSDSAAAVRPINSGSTPARTMSAIRAATSLTPPASMLLQPRRGPSSNSGIAGR